MWVKKRHKVVVSIVRPILALYLKLFYKIKYDKPISIDGGALIISNHTTSMDQFIVGLLFKDNLYYMASMDLFQHRFIGKLIKWLVNPIPKEKSKSSDIQAIKSCLKVAKENGNICIFVEGNRNFSGKLGYVDYSIVKLVKALKKPLVICNIEGGYGTEPRWGSKIRKGKMNACVKKIYQYDELKDMDNDDLYKLIIDGITVDDLNYYLKYKGKRRAENLEKIIYICPICGSMHTIYSKKNNFGCSNCGLDVIYQEDLTLKANTDKFKFNYVYEWYDYQLEVIKNMEFSDDKLIYEDNVETYVPRLYKSKKKLGKGSIKLYTDRFVLDLSKEKIEMPIESIEGITLLGKKKMNIYFNGLTYQVFNDQKTNLLKYMNLYYLLKARRGGKDCEFFGL